MTNRDRDSLADLLARTAARLERAPEEQRIHAEQVAGVSEIEDGDRRRYFVDSFVQQALESEMKAAALTITAYIAEYLSPKPRRSRPRIRR